MKEPDRCPYCKRRSERIAFGLSCFHCGRTPRKVNMKPMYFLLVVAWAAAIGATIARYVS